MITITLESGFEYTSYYGGDYRAPMEKRTHKRANGLLVTMTGDFNMLRNYHDLESITSAGRGWIHNKTTGNYKSKDGLFSISKYHGKNNKPIYMIYSAYTWRKNMQSTFGNHVRGVRAKEFESAAEAMEAVKGS